MRAQPPISPLTLGICCVTIAGALALAPGRGTPPVATPRGGDVVALEGSSMDPDGPTAPADPRDRAGEAAVPTTDDAGAPAAGEPAVATESGTPSGRGAGPVSVVAPDDGSRDTAQPTGAPTGPIADSTPDGAPDDTDPGDEPADVDSCRSARAIIARGDGQGTVAPASPCSQGRGHDECQGSACDDGRDRGTSEA